MSKKEKKLLKLPKSEKYRNGFRAQKKFHRPLFNEPIYISGYGATEELAQQDFVNKRDAIFNKYKVNLDKTLLVYSKDSVIKALEQYSDYRQLYFRPGTTYSEFTRLRSLLRPYLEEKLKALFAREKLEKIYINLKNNKNQYKKCKNKVIGWLKSFTRWCAGEDNPCPLISSDVVLLVNSIFKKITEEKKLVPHVKRYYPPDKLIKAIRDPSNPHSYITLWLELAFELGIRRCEGVSITMEDIDFDTKQITIKSSWNNNKWTHKYEQSDLKTDYSYRVISVSDYLLDLIKIYQKENELYNPKHCLFFSKRSKFIPISSTKLNRDLNDFLDRHNIPREIKTHAIRHINCSVLVSNAEKYGLNIKDISKRLGHANPSTTLNVYTECTGNSAKAVNIFKDFRGDK